MVEELIYNSIDANSSNIDVYLDFTLSPPNLIVCDNGAGIKLKDLANYIGKWGYSSKSNDETTFGCKGETLAAIKTVSSRLKVGTL